MLPIVATVGDLAWHLSFLDEPESRSVWSLLSVLCFDSLFLVVGLSVGVCSYLLHERILEKANCLELVARDIAVDFIVAISANRRRSRPAPYKPLMWMDSSVSN
jgi:hypothetical protein